jgi:hypothetical protein
MATDRRSCARTPVRDALANDAANGDPFRLRHATLSMQFASVSHAIRLHGMNVEYHCRFMR